MHSLERSNLILSALQDSGFLAFRDLPSLLHVAPATVRRDLKALEQKGAVRRVRGGVMLPAHNQSEVTSQSPPNDTRPASSVPVSDFSSDQAIARAALELIHPCEEILIGGGTATSQLCRLLAGLNCKVITNSLAILNCLLPQTDTQIIIPSGWVIGADQTIAPLHWDDPMQVLGAKKLFMCPEAVSAQGILQSDGRLIASHHALIDRAETVIVLADSSKFARGSGAIVCGLDRIQIVITDRVPADMEALLAQAGIKVILAA